MLGCKHDWENVSDTILNSPYEQITCNGKYVLKNSKDIEFPCWVFKKTHILILVCKKCGKVEKIITESLS